MIMAEQDELAATEHRYRDEEIAILEDCRKY